MYLSCHWILPFGLVAGVKFEPQVVREREGGEGEGRVVRESDGGEEEGRWLGKGRVVRKREGCKGE